MIFVTMRLKSTIFVIKITSFDFGKFICNKYWSYLTLFIMTNAKLFSPYIQEVRLDILKLHFLQENIFRLRYNTFTYHTIFIFWGLNVYLVVNSVNTFYFTISFHSTIDLFTYSPTKN